MQDTRDAYGMKLMAPTRHVFGLGQFMCLAIVQISLVGGCDRNSPVAAAPPPATVTIAKPILRSVIEWDEYTGRLEAVEFVEVRARIGGLIMSMPFKEGGLVEAGELLVEIDVRPYQAELDAMIAAEAEAAANVELASIELNHILSIPVDSRSKTELDTATAEHQKAKALQAAAEANVDAARLRVEWCRVTAPISGRISRKFVTPGNLISGGSGEGTLLTTITSEDPIYCYVNADERSVLKYAELARTGERVSARNARIPCQFQLANETGYPHAGEVDFVDNRVDPSTGTIRGRGVFPNTDGTLLPGYFARVRIPGSGRYDALLVPDDAVLADQNERILYVINNDDVVQPRPVTLGAQFGTLRAIKSGIGPDDRVVINGLMHARPGVAVNPVEGVFLADSLPNDLMESPADQQERQVTPPTSLGEGVQP